MLLLCLNVALILLEYYIEKVHAHARMLNPPGRSSMWRYGYDVPVNYDDNGLFCGGYRNTVLHDGKCGVCGDPIQGPYENEAGGTYAKGIIVRHYPSGGVYMKATIDVTAYHKGYFEFRLCPHDNPAARVQQNCLDKYLLEISEGHLQGNPTRFYPRSAGIYHLNLKLPADVACYQCVLQWKYTTGNFWGTGSDGRSCMGCGYQELFINCADIAIGNDGTSEQIHDTIYNGSNSHVLDPMTKDSVILTDTPKVLNSFRKSKIDNGSMVVVDRKMTAILPENIVSNRSDNCNKCHALPTWKHFPRMDEWCDINCKNGNCPPCRCFCGCPDIIFQNPCKGMGNYSSDYKMESWCWRECCESECPVDKCACSIDFKNSERNAETNVNPDILPDVPSPDLPSDTSQGKKIETTLSRKDTSDFSEEKNSQVANPELSGEEQRVLQAFLGKDFSVGNKIEIKKKAGIPKRHKVDKNGMVIGARKSSTADGTSHIWGSKMHPEIYKSSVQSKLDGQIETVGNRFNPNVPDASILQSNQNVTNTIPNTTGIAVQTTRKGNILYKTLKRFKGRIRHVDPYVLDLRLLSYILKTIKSWFSKNNVYMVI